MPDEPPRSYTATQIAKFSRWYLQDYPVYVWEHPSGLFVVGYPPNSMQKYNISVDASYLYTYIFGLIASFIVNMLLMLILFWHSTHKVEKAVRPILTGINTMARGKAVKLEERGELALPAEARKQAGIIRKQGKKLRQLITDLNLASKLEYAMQPMKKCLLAPLSWHVKA